MEEAVKNIINEKIKPVLQQDGGDIELLSVKDGVVKVSLRGACCGCPMSQLTLRGFVEQTLKKELPEIKKVESE
ncbi:MAG: NifU family protein [Candidatus Omnitrophica bacterium]|nr:NifU family protein [Candidatus Omnitrophota bacterium]MDD5488211.1 NifU family protein [Candidatus Omnitrophota bacterium]